MVRINVQRMNAKAARIAANHPVAKRKQQELYDALKFEASKHIDTGELIDSIKKVEVDGDYGTKIPAVHVEREHLWDIEYGGFRGKGKNRTYQEGLGIIRKAVDSVRGPK